MALLDTFKQKVLDLGRGEAKTKVKPLLVGEEVIDRSAAGLDRRVQESFVLFWLLSDRALFLVAGAGGADYAFRVPYEAIEEMILDFDEREEFLPWYLHVRIAPEGSGLITTLRHEHDPEKPLSGPPPRLVEADDRQRLSQGGVIPLAGFAAVPRKFIEDLEHRMELTQASLTITGAEAAEQRRRMRRRPKSA